MGFYVSPQVQVVEKDITTSVRGISTTVGATVGNFQWGPVDEAILIPREDVLYTTFLGPNDTNAEDWFCAANFLAYSNALYVARTVGAGALNATDVVDAATNTPIGHLIKNLADFEAQSASGTLDTIGAAGAAVIAKYPGTYGNNISVDVADSNNFGPTWTTPAPNNIPLAPLFDRKPEAGELAIAVSLNNEVVETFIVSTNQTAKDAQGNSLYVEDVIARKSNYIWVNGAVISGSTAAGAPVNYTLAGGADSIPVAGDYQATWTSVFGNPGDIDIGICITGGSGPALGVWIVQNIAEARKDCVVTLSPAKADVVGNANPLNAIVAERGVNGAANVSSSYGFMDGNYKYQYDRYNDTYRWIPLNGDTAGLMAYTEGVADAWFSPAGYIRGKIKNVVKLAWNPVKAERDELYKVNINPVITEKGEGSLLYGDKTLLTQTSAFQFINVRRLFIVLEKSIATAAKYSLFEINDQFTQSRFTQMVEPFLRRVKGRRGVYDFRVICDDRNNTPEVIDNGEFVADILVKPARSIEAITLNFTAVKTGVDFKEIVG